MSFDSRACANWMFGSCVFMLMLNSFIAADAWANGQPGWAFVAATLSAWFLALAVLMWRVRARI